MRGTQRFLWPLIALLLGLMPASAQENRWRNMSAETIAGRKLTLRNGAEISYFRDGRIHILNGQGTERTGRWSIGAATLFAEHPRSIRITLDQGPAMYFSYWQSGDRLFHVRLRRGGGEVRVPVVRIDPL